MLAWVLPIYERGRAAYDRLVEIYMEPIEISEGSHLHLHIPPKSEILFKELNFAYPRFSHHALKNINLTIKGGSFVGITGPVGAGKTTLFRLLNREYEIPKGMIFLGGRDIHDYSFEAFSQSIVTVEQIPFLFSKSIAENVSFGKEGATQEELELVAEMADLHDTVLEFPDQYNTVIGERGVTLSGGQKQRLAMARAFLVNRSILLLDDIFSAVDAATEKRIFNAMKMNFIDKTVLMITHRVSILEQMDLVIYMKNGEIVENGSPLDLFNQKGYYRTLFDLQFLGGKSR
jgi:ATP-binding cassette subfamily B protein